jgi:hypothetical protein
LLSLLLCASVIKWVEPDLAGISDSAITLVRSGVKVDWQNGAVLQNLSKDEHLRNATLPVHDRAFLLYGSKRNEVLSLLEIEQYGLDSFADPNYLSIYGMSLREWYGCGIRLLGRTAVECTPDALGDRIGRDVASVATCMPSNQCVVIDLFAGSCNALFWILRHLPDSEGIGFESDAKVFELTHRNLAALGQRIEVVSGDYARLLERPRFCEDRGIVAFVSPPWGTALDEVQGLDLNRNTPPISEVIEQVVRAFSHHKMSPHGAPPLESVPSQVSAAVSTPESLKELRCFDLSR